MTRATSPASSGPAGPHFEGQVGANYLLSMLVGAEPRGLPGAAFDSVQFQRAAEGFPLDDVIVRAHDANGAEAIIEVQVKRSITFSPSDPVFESVVAQMVRASEIDGFWQRRHHELAIATSQTSRKIAGAYQDLLSWARELSSGAVFIARINRLHSANEDMRKFVQTFRAHLLKAGAPHGDEDVWRLLRRVQIHVYDFTAPGSAAEDLARDRAARALHVDDTPKAGKLWSDLIQLSIKIAAVGGERSRDALLSDLVGFRLAGDRRYHASRNAIAEASTQALVDIKDRILNISLGRNERVAAIRQASETGRYIEIRGDAGVGKSALLKHFARLVGTEGRCIVLSPNRVTPRGWTAMRDVIGFEGTARDLFRDLAADGGGFLFIDNLDFFREEEQTTIKDLMREAAETPGMIVITTARTRWGNEGMNWLPPEALDRLSGSQPIVIGELVQGEIDELREGDSRLHALLAEGHPAKAVTRNLFRLTRLAEMSPDQPNPRSEVDMAELWWNSADGRPDDGGFRDRFRLLRDLSARSLTREQTFDVHQQPAKAIDALIASETLRDMGNDRVAFRHDVLREWAIAQHLTLEANALVSCALDRPAPPELARGVELAARIALEKNRDVGRWVELLEIVSGERHHKSWRRAVLLAIVHSELANELLPLVQDVLLANEGALLRELLPLMMAVDARPAKDFLVPLGIDPKTVPETVNFPSSLSWSYMVSWLLEIVDFVPPRCLPEIVEFFSGWCWVGGILQVDPLTPAILTHFKGWLIELETASEAASWQKRHDVFGGVLDSDQLDRLEEDIRQTFVILALRVPKLAAEYLRSVRERRQKKRIYSKLLKFRGSLSQAAPAELAAMTLDALVRSPRKRTERGDRYDNDALTHADKEFLPASPAQGLFLELLIHAPKLGLALIRSLIASAIAFHTEGKLPTDNDAFIIELPDGPRRFPWTRTYGWSRRSHYYSITSALMALETWAHGRIERGEDVSAVLAEMLGEYDAPAAYLLVVVDILISHWPATRTAAVPYVANPELLAVDYLRPTQENIKYPYFLGLDAFQREPAGPKLDALQSRPSRRFSLDALLLRYAHGEWDELRDQAKALLTKALERLGSFQSDDNLSHPRLMAVHALNLLDPSNYRDVEVEQNDGSKVRFHEFVAPDAEAKHFESKQEANRERSNDAGAAQCVNALVDHPEKSSPEYAEVLTAWARKERNPETTEDPGDLSYLDQAIVGAALIAMRDCAPQHREENREWAESVFAGVLQREPDFGGRLRTGMLYNPVAIAFAGRVFATDGSADEVMIGRLLEMAAGDAAAAHGAKSAAVALRSLDERLSRALLRVAFAACIQPRYPWDTPDDVKASSDEEHQMRLQRAILLEIEWLKSRGEEPPWPPFPRDNVYKRKRRFIRIGASHEIENDEAWVPPDVLIDHQAAALWLESLWCRGIDADRLWLRDVCASYEAWTFAANGANLPEDEEVTEAPLEWNRVFFAAMANCIPELDIEEAERVIAPITALPERNFFDVTKDFLR